MNYEPQTPAQLQVYNAALAAGIDRAAIRLFIAGERERFSTDPDDGAVLYNGIPIDAALRLNPEIAGRYKASSHAQMTLSEFVAEQLAGRIKTEDLRHVQIVGNDNRKPSALPSRPATVATAAPNYTTMTRRDFIAAQNAGKIPLNQLSSIRIEGD